MVKCSICGKEETRRFTGEVMEQMQRQQACFTCNFWLSKIPYRHYPNSVRINGTHFFIHPDSNTCVKGHGGRHFVIEFFDGREVETRNLWCQGEIPTRFQNRLPDNATFKEVE